MKRLWIVLLLVLGLLMVEAGPVLAAIVWEWNIGDVCEFMPYLPGIDDWDIFCDGSLGIPLYNGEYTSWAQCVDCFESEESIPVSVETTTCPSINLCLNDGGGPDCYTLPATIDFSLDVSGRYLIAPENEGGYCYISRLIVGEEDIQPEPSALDFDLSMPSIFDIAGTLVTGLASMIAVIAGLYLGFRVVQSILQSLRRW